MAPPAQSGRDGGGRRAREDPRVDAIGLADHAHRPREIACLPWIDAAEPCTDTLEGVAKRAVVTAGRLEDDPCPLVEAGSASSRAASGVLAIRQGRRFGWLMSSQFLAISTPTKRSCTMFLVLFCGVCANSPDQLFRMTSRLRTAPKPPGGVIPRNRCGMPSATPEYRKRRRQELVEGCPARKPVVLLVQRVKDLRVGQELVQPLTRVEPGIPRQTERELPHRSEPLDLHAVLMQPRLAASQRFSWR